MWTASPTDQGAHAHARRRAVTALASDALAAAGGEFPPIDDHHAVGETQGKGVLWIDFDQIAILGVDFDVHEPPELAEHLRELAGRLMRAAGPSA